MRTPHEGALSLDLAHRDISGPVWVEMIFDEKTVAFLVEDGELTSSKTRVFLVHLAGSYC